MPSRRPHVSASAAQSELAAALSDLRTQFELPAAFAPDVLAEAEAAAAAVELPALDLTAVEFVTIDPDGSRDLDQALHIEADGDGYRVRYAIADVPTLVSPGGAVDAEARRRGQTVYAADGSIPLHPPAIGEGAGSLLPDAERGAFVWDFALDAAANVTSATVRRARIRSREQLTYAGAQAAIDNGGASETLTLLRSVGQARIVLERERGGASLDSPDEEIVYRDGTYTLVRRTPLPVEDWNAQISLMTGMAAASLMLEARVGILRTMPPPGADELNTFRAQTVALEHPWPQSQPYGEYLRALDRNDPSVLAILRAATSLFRGAGYVVLDGSVPAETIQAAVAAPYAHTTAPLRRLVDRWNLVVCEAICSETEVPAWARDSLDQLPPIMADTSRVAAQLNAASVNRVEAALLSSSVGRSFAATILSVRSGKATVQLVEPAVTATCPAPADARPGGTTRVTLDAVDIATGTIEFSVA
jgi:exoribonuclease R